MNNKTRKPCGSNTHTHTHECILKKGGTYLRLPLFFWQSSGMEVVS